MSYSTGAATGETSVGGLVGESHGSITASYSTAFVTGDWRVGGLVGSNSWAIITASYSAASVTGEGEVGGLVGANYNQSDIDSCYSDSTVTGNQNVGGLVGRHSGWYSTITQSYSSSAVSGDENVGGLVGRNRSNSSIARSFWDIETSGCTNMCGIQEQGATGCDDSFGLTTSEMQVASTFLEAGWDFVDIWGIGENQTYPYLLKNSAADINQDKIVNFGDLAILAENWLTDNTP
jgi:hypothetical protein